MKGIYQCIIGCLYDSGSAYLMSASGLNDILKQYADIEKVSMVDPVYTEIYHKRTYSIYDYLDRRKSTNLVRFKYCPYCGKKIDWKKLKDDAKKGLIGNA